MINHKAEAERLAEIIETQVGGRAMSAADTIALGQLHAALHLAERIDQLTMAVSTYAR